MGTNKRVDRRRVNRILCQNHNETIGHLGVEKVIKVLKKNIKYQVYWKR